MIQLEIEPFSGIWNILWVQNTVKICTAAL